jgi:hypothetical protein
LDYVNQATGVAPGIVQFADDFDVPVGVQWTIQSVFVRGFFNPTDPPTGNQVPTSWNLQILNSVTFNNYIIPKTALFSGTVNPVSVNGLVVV